MGKSLFEQWMFEAPGDDPAPDVAPEPETPDVPDAAPMDDGPPDLGGDDFGDTPDLSGGDDAAPPDLGGDDEAGDDSYDDFGMDANGEDPENMGLDDKVSAVLNLNLYQSYLELLSQLGSQMTSMKNNADLLYAITPDVETVINGYKTLDENIRLYIDNHYVNERYEKNLLFYNKCKNLNKFLNDKFDFIINKGIKGSSNH